MLMRRTLWALVLAAVAAALLLPAVPAAAAQQCAERVVKNPDGSISYTVVCVEVNPGTPGTPGGEVEDCGQDEANLPYEGAPFCYGGLPCQYTDNIVPLAPPATPAPEGQKWQARYCTNGATGTKELVLTGGTQPRPLIVQAQEAFGNLAPPAGQVRHSPGVRGIVGLATYLWLVPGSFGELRGSSAEGLVAVAEPDTTLWRTGDGGAVTCAGGGTPDSAACSHTYRRASARYDGNVTRNWVVHYEQNGAVIDIPGAPVALTADTAWALSVAEAQVVTGERPGR
jgi:hypothetical protein